LKRQVTFEDIEHKTFAVLCFSLLLNRTDLDSIKDFFKLILTVFKSQRYSTEVERAK
jgi:hypothetical protein